eukprot:CAMPEP_0194313586 /NCGR_PEP_ID=MMETSP0171-20130528/10455_1 /TAXON_ID=218684 /ORGANISM="Corethron pennatum, Strain L29A3" /LENGTH=80 /DNA_ID=CAMNT_0039068607 /DNA_START=9 /DNA_END=248 /DNA_ORIENTATION=+
MVSSNEPNEVSGSTGGADPDVGAPSNAANSAPSNASNASSSAPSVPPVAPADIPGLSCDPPEPTAAFLVVSGHVSGSIGG